MQLEKLVVQARNGAETAREELYKQTVRSAYLVACKIVHKDEDAIDLVHDAYITAFDKLDQLDDPARFQSWFNQIVANKCRDYLKKKRPMLFSELAASGDFEPEWEDEREENMPDIKLDREETIRLVWEILDALPEEQRLCVILYYQNEMSISEIAEALEISEGTVKSRLNYARKKVKQQVEQLEKEGTKLYGAAPFPFFLWLLKGEKSMASVPLEATSAAAVGISTAAAGSVIEKITASIGVKIVTAITAVAVLAGGVTLAVRGKNERETVPETAQIQVQTEVESEENDQKMEAVQPEKPTESLEENVNLSAETDMNLVQNEAEMETEDNEKQPAQTIDIEIETETFTLKLPAEWEGKYLITEQNGWLSVYEKGSHEAMGAGNLFSITSFSIGVDYHFPSYDYLGTYVHDGEQYEFIMLYATDMQATEATRERYAAMKDTVPWIIEHMEWHWERVDEAEP